MKWIGAVAFILTGMSSPAYGEQEPYDYAKVGTWLIRVDTTIDGCFMTTAFGDDKAFRVGVAEDGKTFYLLFGDSDWKSIEYLLIHESHPAMSARYGMGWVRAAL